MAQPGTWLLSVNLDFPGWFGGPCLQQSGATHSGYTLPQLTCTPIVLHRLCSEVKPVLRAQLLAGGGYTLVASIGDQVSDLTGPASAPASYK